MNQAYERNKNQTKEKEGNRSQHEYLNPVAYFENGEEVFLACCCESCGEEVVLWGEKIKEIR